MTTSIRLFAAALGVAISTAVGPALAGAADFAFEPVEAGIKNGPTAELAVRLVDKRTGKPVAGAVIFRTQLDMSPDDMAGMLATPEALPAAEPGVYRFMAGLTMAGRWALTLQAKVPGEAETIQATVVFQAKD